MGNLGNLVKVKLAHNGTDATISITGPSSVWFGVSFDATLILAIYIKNQVFNQ